MEAIDFTNSPTYTFLKNNHLYQNPFTSFQSENIRFYFLSNCKGTQILQLFVTFLLRNPLNLELLVVEEDASTD